MKKEVISVNTPIKRSVSSENGMILTTQTFAPAVKDLDVANPYLNISSFEISLDAEKKDTLIIRIIKSSSYKHAYAYCNIVAQSFFVPDEFIMLYENEPFEMRKNTKEMEVSLKNLPEGTFTIRLILHYRESTGTNINRDAISSKMVKKRVFKDEIEYVLE